MSPYASDPNEERRYVLEEDKDLEDGDKRKTVFLLRNLKATQMAKIEDGMAKAQPKKKGGHVDLNVGTQVLDILDAGLVGVENFHKADGTEMTFNFQNKRERFNFYDHLSPSARQELADEITTASTLSEEEQENL